MIKTNTGDVVGSDVVMNAGSRFVLTCEGDSPVTWIPRLYRHNRYIKPSGNRSTFNVSKATVDLTGTHKCGYSSRNANFSSVHVFVRGGCINQLSEGMNGLGDADHVSVSCISTSEHVLSLITSWLGLDPVTAKDHHSCDGTHKNT